MGLFHLSISPVPKILNSERTKQCDPGAWERAALDPETRGFIHEHKSSSSLELVMRSSLGTN